MKHSRGPDNRLLITWEGVTPYTLEQKALTRTLLDGHRSDDLSFSIEATHPVPLSRG